MRVQATCSYRNPIRFTVENFKRRQAINCLPVCPWHQVTIDIQMKAVMQREHLALHARGDDGGLACDLDGFTLPDDEVSDFEVEGFFCQRSN